MAASLAKHYRVASMRGDTLRIMVGTRKTDGSPPAPRPRPRLTVLGVAGELLLTGGVVVLLFLGWQLWWNDAILAASQTASAHELSEKWDESGSTTAPVPSPTASAGAVETAPDYGEPLVAAEPDHADVIGNLYVPRYGDSYVRTIAEGTTGDILNSTRLGLGHYDGTQMPGAVGNFAIAAHRSAYGGGMHLINEFHLGDPIIVETADGWYTYRFTNLEYVDPTEVGVLAPVPQEPGVDATDRTITLTSCNPLYSTAERIIAYGAFDNWRPRSAGPPPEIAAAVQKQEG
jgi:sortase A